MRITDLLDVKSISLDLAPGSKSEALDMAIDLMVKRQDKRQRSLQKAGLSERRRKHNRNW